MLATLQTPTIPVTAVLAGLWKDDLRLGAKPALQQLPQLLPSVQVLQQQPKQQHTPSLMSGSQEQQAPLRAERALQQPMVGGSEQTQQASPRASDDHGTAAAPSGCGATSPASSAPTRAGYSTDSYWDNRYAQKSTHFDWFYNYSALASLIGATCSREGPCLHVGCGNSGLSEGMAQDGYQVGQHACRMGVHAGRSGCMHWAARCLHQCAAGQAVVARQA